MLVSSVTRTQDVLVPERYSEIGYEASQAISPDSGPALRGWARIVRA